MKSFNELIEKVKSMPPSRLAVVAAQDLHTLQAVKVAYDEGIIAPVLIGRLDEIEKLMKNVGLTGTDISLVACDDVSKCAEKAAEMAKASEIDVIMKGKIETGALMKVMLNRETGIKCGDTISGLALLESPNYHKLFALTDIALNTYPDVNTKKAIIENSVAIFHAFGVEQPKVAALCAVEKVNPKMPETVEANEIKENWQSGWQMDCIFEGPISLDLAVSKEACEIKGFCSPVGGDADIMLMPDIQAGNIAVKMATTIGGCKVAGMMSGAKVPIIVLSRSDSAESKYLSIVANSYIGACARLK